MTETRARQLEWSVLAIAILFLGLVGGYTDYSQWLPGLRSAFDDATQGTLLLIVVGFSTRALHHRIAPVVCTVAGCAWIAAGVQDELATLAAASGMSPYDVTLLCTGCLAVGALIDQLPFAKVAGYVVCATLYLCAAVGSAGSLVAIIFAHLAQGVATTALPTLFCAALSVVGLYQLVGRPTASLASRFRGLVGPLAVAGVVGTFVSWQLIVGYPDLSHGHQLAWMITASGLLLLLTLAALTIVRSASDVMVARRSIDRSRALVRRQRTIMHARTNALRQTQLQYKELFASVPAPVVLTHPSGAVIAANPALVALLGVDSERDLKEKNFVEFYADPKQRSKLIADWATSEKVIHQGEVVLRRADGEPRTVLFTSRVIKAPRTNVIDYLQGTFTDITELRRAEATQRRLENHLRLSQKLESVGRLAAGIAHEINTPMQYIGDNVYFLKEAFESFQKLLEQQEQALSSCSDVSAADVAARLRTLEARADVDAMIEALPGALARTTEGIKTVSGIVAAMKELAHPGEGAKASTDVNALLETAITVTRNAHKTVAAVETAFGDLPTVLAYKNELCQVFINLIVNAADAIDTAQKADHRAGRITIRTRADERCVHIEIADNGSGIPSSILEKIFDPFFTTKGVGKGTGQGLALARATVVDKHGGEIDVESVVGHGSKFSITLPFIDYGSPSGSETP